MGPYVNERRNFETENKEAQGFERISRVSVLLCLRGETGGLLECLSFIQAFYVITEKLCRPGNCLANIARL